jgi:hypothetical protein
VQKASDGGTSGTYCEIDTYTFIKNEKVDVISNIFGGERTLHDDFIIIGDYSGKHYILESILELYVRSNFEADISNIDPGRISKVARTIKSNQVKVTKSYDNDINYDNITKMNDPFFYDSVEYRTYNEYEGDYPEVEEENDMRNKEDVVFSILSKYPGEYEEEDYRFTKKVLLDLDFNDLVYIDVETDNNQDYDQDYDQSSEKLSRHIQTAFNY